MATRKRRVKSKKQGVKHTEKKKEESEVNKKKLSPSLAIASFILNILILPGLGTLIGGEVILGVLQLIFFALGILLAILFNIIVGIVLIIIIWISALITGINLIKKADSLEGGEEDTKKKQERQIRIILFGVLLVMVFTISFIVFYRNASNFTYRGVKFQRENMNGLIFYKTNLQFTRQDGIFKFTLYTRNDPRRLEKIPANVTILLKKGGFVSF